MDQHKIENFLKANSGLAFPEYMHLDESQATALRNLIAKSVDSSDLDGLSIVKKLYAAGTEANGIQADDTAFSIERLIRELRVECSENVYLNWYRFDDIDQISLTDLDQYFSDLWYPGSDDLDIFDDSADWVVSITHYGKVMLFERPMVSE
jgi:hypothetical protein